MLIGILTALLVLCILVLIILVTVFQHGNEGGIGSSFGGGNSSGFFGATGGANIIIRATWITGILLFVLSTTLAWVRTNTSFGVSREIDAALEESVSPPQSGDSIQSKTEEETELVDPAADQLAKDAQNAIAPNATEPSATEPSATEPSATEPSASEPNATEQNQPQESSPSPESSSAP